MRKLAIAIVIGLLASVGATVASAPKAAAGSSPQLKVVLVVGAVEGATASYIADADAAAAEFAHYTSNIVKVYSPNATWAAVQTAAQGASVLVYLGHGNGYPNPYNSKLYTDRDNGMGLNATANAGNSNKKYYGELYMAQLQLAPNAVVLLNHLCYASGNSESGQGLPSLSTAETRVDGFGAGFLRGNARAVIAEGLGNLNWYIDHLFTPGLTIDQIWKTYPNFHNHVTTWSSTRNAGYTSEIDPDVSHPQSDGDIYYRSMVAQPGLTTDAIGVGVTYQPTTYTAIDPVRLLDSRTGNGFGGKLAANSPRGFQVAGRGVIPAGATAVTGNVAVTGQTRSGAIYVGPAWLTYPTTSTVNFPAGAVVDNGVTVALSPTGYLYATYMAASGNKTDLVFDATGYFMPDQLGSTYHAVDPARLVDTRKGVGGIGGLVYANRPVTFDVWLHGNVPLGATAITGNATGVGATGSCAFFLGPKPLTSPTTSTVNFKAGQTVGNNLTVALSDTGTLSATYIAKAGNHAALVFDVTGYYTHDLTGARYVPITPVRLLDTRAGNGHAGKLSANSALPFQITGRGDVPDGSAAVSANATVVNETTHGAIFIGPVANNAPLTSTLNFASGEIRGNGLTVLLGDGGILTATYMAASGNKTDLVVDVTGYFAPIPAP